MHQSSPFTFTFTFTLTAEPPFPTLRRVEKKVKELREAEARPTTEEDVIYVCTRTLLEPNQRFFAT